MVDSVNAKFRSSYGLDAGGEKLINVKLADRNTLSDGVSVAYVIQENTIQQFDPLRSYIKGFAVLYNNRIWIARDPINPGPFQEPRWQPLRVDPRWIQVTSDSPINSGDFITIPTNNMPTVNNLILTLPKVGPQGEALTEGETVVIKDTGGEVGTKTITIKTQGEVIAYGKLTPTEFTMSIPFSECYFIYTNKQWRLYVNSPEDNAIVVDPNSVHQISSSQQIIRNYSSQKAITLKFPKNANHGDMIEFVGTQSNASTAFYHLILNTYDANTSIGESGKTTMEIRRQLSGYFVFDGNNKLWRLYDSSFNPLRIITTDTNTIIDAFPNEDIIIGGKSNTAVSTTTVNLPTKIEKGQTVTIGLNYLRSKQTALIKAGTGDKIRTNKNLLQFPKRSDYPPLGANWVDVDSVSFTGETDYVPVLTLVYDEETIANVTKGVWWVASNHALVERVDPLNRHRTGVIALATQIEANLESDKLTANSKEVAITPETLSNRKALETQTGIARIAVEGEVQVVTGGVHANDVIVTPRRLNERQATETIRGLAEIALQADVNTGSNTRKIVTPKTLNDRKATEALTGLIGLTKKDGVAPVAGTGITRDSAGTGIYDHNNHTTAVTPKTLREFKATELASGTVWLGTLDEVISGSAAAVGKPTVVTPEMLHKKTSTVDRIGLIQIASQAEVEEKADAKLSNAKAVTPFTLGKRVALEDRTGIAKLATKIEFDTGALNNVIVSPLRVKERFDNSARTSVNSESGLVENGTLWNHYKLDIVAATEGQRGTLKLATKALVDAGTDDTTAVTPKKLADRKATVSTDGIIQLASQAEVDAGTDIVKAVTPKRIKDAVQKTLSWQATNTTRGTVQLSNASGTWQGDSTKGNQGVDLETFAHDGWAVTPREFNRVLQANYLPLNATADNAVKFNGLATTDFVRRTIAQTITGAMTFSANTVFNAKINVAGDNESKGFVRTDSGFHVNKVINGNSDNVGIQLATGMTSNTAGVRPMYGMYAGSMGTSVLDPNEPGPYLSSNRNHGKVTSSYAVYLTCAIASPTERRGWIFKTVQTRTGQDSIHENVASINTVGDASFNGVVNTQDSFTVAGYSAVNSHASGGLTYGANSLDIVVRSKDAKNIQAIDPSGTYKLLTTKNYEEVTKDKFVQKSGDSMSGPLSIAQASVTAYRTEADWMANGRPTADTAGMWAASITNPTFYLNFRGYMVPTYEPDNPNVVRSYEEFKGPGLLTQFGTDLNNIYQIWTPRPKDAVEAARKDHNANTIWFRTWNPLKKSGSTTGVWEEWGRMFSSNQKPTASDIGAVADNGTEIDSLSIKNWLKIDHIKIYADPVSKSVKFEWID